MRKKRYSEEQIVSILNEVEAGKTVSSVSREYGVSENTIFRWKNKYKGIDKTEIKKLRELEKENARLKRIVAEQALDNQILKDVLSKEW